jgi:hypothetical protein
VVFSSLIRPPAGRYFNDRYAAAGFSDPKFHTSPPFLRCLHKLRH